MKKQLLSLIALLSLVLTLAPANLASSSSRLRAKIPFDFMVGKTSLPAGDYTVSRNSQGVLFISNENRRDSVYSLASGGKSSRQPSPAKLVFRRYGKTYFLAQVWDQDSTIPMQLPESSAERKIARS